MVPGKEVKIEPGRLAMAARSIRSVRLSLTNSEENDEGVAPPERVPPFSGLRLWATGTSTEREPVLPVVA